MFKWSFGVRASIAISILLLIFASGYGIATGAEENALLTSDERNNIKIFSDVSPSVVYVTNTQVVRQRFSFNAMEVPRGSGTGFVWDDEGLIVTNYHVIYGAHKVLITLHDGQTYEAENVGVAPEKDIALLRIKAPDAALQPIVLGDS